MQHGQEHRQSSYRDQQGYQAIFIQGLDGMNDQVGSGYTDYCLGVSFECIDEGLLE